jgi:hypothetical protein
MYVALLGLIIAVLCCATLFLLRDFNPHPHVSDPLVILYFTFIIAVDLAAILGLIVMMVGLIMAGALALRKRVGHPS